MSKNSITLSFTAQTAPAHMTKTLLNFNTQVEHIGEALVVLLVGVLLSASLLDLASAPNVELSTLLWLVPSSSS